MTTRHRPVLESADKNGHFSDIVLGYDDLNGYIASIYFGALIGRSAIDANGNSPSTERIYPGINIPQHLHVPLV